MQKSFVLIFLLTLELFSCSSGFHLCKKKVSDAKVFSSSSLFWIPLKNSTRLIYSKCKPDFKYKKYDPYLGIALISDKSHFAYPFKLKSKYTKSLSAIGKKSQVYGFIAQQQCGVEKLAKFSKPLKEASVITDNCCDMQGVSVGDGIIDRYYLKHFLNFRGRDVLYADAGIRIDKRGLLLHVKSVNPFFSEQKFHTNDIILAFDSKRVNSLCKLKRQILFSKIGSTHRFKILRNTKTVYIDVKFQKRLGGGLLSDTFLEHLGLYFDENLCINRRTPQSVKAGLNIADCLIQINFKDVNSDKQIRQSIKSADIDNALLFERNNFQFFIHINGKSGKITKNFD